MTIIGAAFAFLVARGGFPGRGQVEKAVPKNAVDAAKQEFRRASQPKHLNFIGAKSRDAYFRYPDRQIGYCADFIELFWPIVKLPMIPVEGKPVDTDRVEVFEQIVAFEQGDERGINRGNSPEDQRQVRAILPYGHCRQTHHFRELAPLRVHVKIPVRQVVRFVPELDCFDHDLVFRCG